MAKPRAVEVHVEDLVLYGFAAGERHRIAAAFQQELTRLIREQGFPKALGAAATAGRLGGRPAQVRAGGSARETGARVAAAVYRSLAAGGVRGGVRSDRFAAGVRPR